MAKAVPDVLLEEGCREVGEATGYMVRSPSC